MEFGVEDRDAGPVGGEGVGVGSGESFDEAVETEAAQVVGHLAGGVVGVEESGDEPAKASVGEAGDGVDDTAQGAGQGYGAWIAEAERSGSLALPCVGLMDALEERRADGTALTGTLDHKQTTVDLAGLVDQLAKVLEPGQDPEVGGLVDDGLDSQRPPFFEVLLDARMLVAEVHLHLGARREQPGDEGLFGGGANLAGEHHGGVRSSV